MDKRGVGVSEPKSIVILAGEMMDPRLRAHLTLIGVVDRFDTLQE
jgi:hypothetical protein